MAGKEGSGDVESSVKKKDNIKISVSIPKDGTKDKKKEDEEEEPEDQEAEAEPSPEDVPDATLDPNAAQDDGTEGGLGPDGLPLDPEAELNGLDGDSDPLAGMEPEPVVNDMRDVKLYDLMSALETYIKYFVKAISNIDQSQLSADQNTKMVKYYNDMKKDLDDIGFYMRNDYEVNDYQKNLYTYLLFNKSLAQTIKHVRSVLDLSASDLEDEDKKQS